MTDYLISLTTALWSGLLTTIHPCPLAANIAGILLLSTLFRKNSRVIAGGIFYILGRVAAYGVLGVIISTGLLAVDKTAGFLSGFFNLLQGPLFLVSGMFLSGLILPRASMKLARTLERYFLQKTYSPAGSFFLGFIMSFAFCPATAALFFGVLIPLSVVHKAAIVFPIAYGIGAGLPVVLMVILMLKSVDLAGKKIQRWEMEFLFTKVSGGLLILIGIYFSLEKIWRVF